MAKPKPISEQLREAILASAKSRYRISKETGLTEAGLSRFVNHVAGLSLDSIDKLGACLNIRLVVEDQPKRRTKGKQKWRV